MPLHSSSLQSSVYSSVRLITQASHPPYSSLSEPVLVQACRHAVLGGLLLGLSAGALAQTAPNAGQLLQENRQAPALPPAAPALPGPLPAPERPASDSAASGPSVVLREVRVQEVPGIDAAQLRASAGLDQAVGQSLQLNGLRELAERVTAYLRSQGLMVARAWLPEQDLSQGVLQINVMDGRYGKVQVQEQTSGQGQPGSDSRNDNHSDSALVSEAQRWLEPLQPGQVITQDTLLRRLLLLSDLPGIRTQSLLRPGSGPGEADLLVGVEPTPRWSGRVGIDNFGNRYAGRERITAGLDVQPGWIFGDKASLDVLGTPEKTWQAAASYSLPLGMDGWRLQTQVSHTNYELGKEFSSLGAHGTADTVQLGVSYPLVRTPSFNLRTGMTLQYRSLKDVRDAIPSSDRKSAQGAQLSMSADWLQSHAVTWGVLSLNAGKLSLSDAQQKIDSTTARSAGRYNRLNLDAARLQALVGDWSLYGRVSAQWASKNLDDSEKMVLGGATGVRAWPTGEAVGDQGWLAQLELRWKPMAAWQTYVFVDAGSVRINESPWAAGNNRRSIAGRGLGVRYEAMPIKLDLALARRNGSAASQADPHSSRNRVWVTATYMF